MALEDKSVRAIEQLHRLIETYQPQETHDDVGYLVVPAEVTQEEWITEAERKNQLMARYGVRNLGALDKIEREERRKSRPK